MGATDFCIRTVVTYCRSFVGNPGWAKTSVSELSSCCRELGNLAMFGGATASADVGIGVDDPLLTILSPLLGDLV